VDYVSRYIFSIVVNSEISDLKVNYPSKVVGSSNIFLIRKYSPRVNVSLPNGYTSKKSENCFLECELGG